MNRYGEFLEGTTTRYPQRKSVSVLLILDFYSLSSLSLSRLKFPQIPAWKRPSDIDGNSALARVPLKTILAMALQF